MNLATNTLSEDLACVWVVSVGFVTFLLYIHHKINQDPETKLQKKRKSTKKIFFISWILDKS